MTDGASARAADRRAVEAEHAVTMIQELVLGRHGPLHEELIPELLDGLNESQLRRRVHPELPPIAWLLWHMARCEDVGANRLASDGPQVLDRDGFVERLAVAHRDHGTGMLPEAVDRLADAISLAELHAYRRAVAAATRRVVGELAEAEWRRPLEAERVRSVLFGEGVAGPGASWIESHYVGQTRGWCLMHCCLTHNFHHLGQAVLIKKCCNAVRARATWT